MSKVSLQMLSKEKRILNISRLFNLESCINILDKDIRLKNIGFNITDISKVYELSCGRRDIVQTAFLKVLGETNGNMLLIIKYSNLSDFITKGYRNKVSCSDFMKETAKVLSERYVNQISQITGCELQASVPSIGSGCLENILQSPFFEEDIFSRQSFIFLDVLKSDIFECESTFIYIPFENYSIKKAI